MSDPGVPPPPNVMQISRPWLRDVVIAAEILSRPLTIVVTSVGATVLAFTVVSDEWIVIAIGALLGGAGGVAFLKSRDKIAEITGSKP